MVSFLCPALCGLYNSFSWMKQVIFACWFPLQMWALQYRESSPILHTGYSTVLKKSLVKPRNTAENSTGSVRAPSCSNAAMICVSGNDLCHSASNWDLTLLLTHMLFIAVSVIPLYSRRVCVRVRVCVYVWQHRPAGKETECWYFTACWVKVFYIPGSFKPIWVQLTWHFIYEPELGDTLIVAQDIISWPVFSSILRLIKKYAHLMSNVWSFLLKSSHFTVLWAPF